jgi:trans-aconitate methyltransferase
LVPRSVIESGCGGGDHLHNLSLLAPNVSLHGCDLSTEQLALLQRRHPDLDADVFQADLTLPWSNLWPIANLCFTQAVIMHIHTGNNHLVALTNMFRMATQHVVLMENWKSHNFMDIIRKLYDERRIPWSNLYIYYRISPELNKPHMMIVSSVELDYEPLTKYETMLG